LTINVLFVGLLVIPPHVEEYLVGLKKSLLGGMSTYLGQIVVEIVTAEEWDYLQSILGTANGLGLSDFSARFCLDGENVLWNVGVCTFCDPFVYTKSSGRMNKATAVKKNGSCVLLFDNIK
jgi:hypothetical protein